MHKLFILFIFCAALLTARAEGSVTRIEGTFDACYECFNATSNLRVAKKGVAVYYIDGKGHIQYDTYADSICGEQNGDAIHSDTFGMKLLEAFWPTPLAFNALKADSTATTPESTTLIFDMGARIDKDDAKIMRWIGHPPKQRNGKSDAHMRQHEHDVRLRPQRYSALHTRDHSLCLNQPPTHALSDVYVM